LRLKILRIFGSLLLILALASCSSDPFENAGACDSPGTYKKIDSKLAVCAGLEDNPKYYFEGDSFDAALLLGKAEFQSLTFDTEEPFVKELKARGLDSDFWWEGTEITNDSISRYANGDTRWDALIEANTKRLSATAENETARKFRMEMLVQYRAGKVSRAVAYQAQQDSLVSVEKADKAQSLFNEKLSVLTAEIKRLYKISDSLEVMLFALEMQQKL
jgi:hypothetical protein